MAKQINLQLYIYITVLSESYATIDKMQWLLFIKCVVYSGIIKVSINILSHLYNKDVMKEIFLNVRYDFSYHVLDVPTSTLLPSKMGKANL